MQAVSLAGVIKQPRGPLAHGDQVQLTDPKGRRHRLVLEPTADPSTRTAARWHTTT